MHGVCLHAIKVLAEWECSISHRCREGGDSGIHFRPEIGKAADKTSGTFGHPEHVLKDKNLAITSGARPDADRGNGDLHRNMSCEGLYHGLDDNRIKNVRKSVTFRERLESLATPIISTVFRSEFPAVYTTWGAVQELTTLRGYESIARTTKNPVLQTICERIAKQERRHYAWYFNNARMRLSQSTRAQKLTRFLLERFWTPVGAGVKPPEEVSRLFFTVFSTAGARNLANEMDEKFSTLPGLNGIRIMRPYIEKNILAYSTSLPV